MGAPDPWTAPEVWGRLERRQRDPHGLMDWERMMEEMVDRTRAVIVQSENMTSIVESDW